MSQQVLIIGLGQFGMSLARTLTEKGAEVLAVDRDLGLSAAVRDTPGIEWLQHDLEAQPWPFPDGEWQGVLVSNYLHRPLFPHLLAALAPGGALLYATFAFGGKGRLRPRNPHHLLMPGELLELARGPLRVVAYEDVEEGSPVAMRRQRLAAVLP